MAISIHRAADAVAGAAQGRTLAVLTVIVENILLPLLLIAGLLMPAEVANLRSAAL
jgi:hypothetical protein